MNNTVRLFLWVLICLNPALLTQPAGNGFAWTEVPDPLSGVNPVYPVIAMDLPEAGVSFNDPCFGTQLTRVTTADGIRGRHEYSRFDPFNLDQSMIILDPQSLWIVYRTDLFPYNQPANFVLSLNEDSNCLEEPRWDPIDPDLVWGVCGFSIRTVDVSTGEFTIIKDFSEDPVTGPVIRDEHVYRITMKDEGESSTDKRYWVFFLQGDADEDYAQRFIFTWDRETDTIPGLCEIQKDETNLDWIGMSPLGTFVLIGGDYNNGGRFSGLTLADRELTRFHRLDYAIAHSDVGLDLEGAEVIVMQNTRTDFVDLIPLAWDTKPVLEAGGSYEGTNRTPLVRLYYSSNDPNGLSAGGIHISCNTPGYAVISTHGPDLPETNWLDRTNILVKLDRSHPRAFYLSKVYNTWSSYWEETQAAITCDGSRVVWASNWGQNVGQEEVFLMQLDMPPDWKNQLNPVNSVDEYGPQTCKLGSNFPNPFNSKTKIPFSLKASGHVTLKIFDLIGNERMVLTNADYPAGNHRVNLNAERLPSGIYIYRIWTEAYTAANKLAVLK